MFGDDQWPPELMPKKNQSNFIHKTAIIGVNVVIGKGNYIGPYCFITGGTIIGNNNRLEAYCSIGTPPEHTNFKDQEGDTFIGDNNWFREFVTVNSGTTDVTTLMDGITMLRGSHVGHDSVLENNVILSCNVLIGGHSYLFEGCNFGLGAVCHQRSVIGHWAMIGMNATITKGNIIKPGCTYVGSPARLLRHNVVGLDKFGVTVNQLEKAENEWNQKFSK